MLMQSLHFSLNPTIRPKPMNVVMNVINPSIKSRLRLLDPNPDKLHVFMGAAKEKKKTTEFVKTISVNQQCIKYRIALGLYVMLRVFHDERNFCSYFNGKRVNECLLSLTSDYNKEVPPPTLGPLILMVGFEIPEILEIHDNTNTVTMRLRVKQSWNEDRVRLSSKCRINHGSWIQFNSKEIRQAIWLPSFEIDNLLDFIPLMGLLETRSDKFFYRRADDEKSRDKLYFEYEVICKIMCSMNFNKFPFDEHHCRFQIGTFSSNVKVNLLEWGGSSNNTRISDYSVSLEDSSFLIQLGRNSGSLTPTNGLYFDIKLSRNSKSYIINYFIPSGLFVVVSWMSLVIPPDSIPGRVALIFTTFLVLVNIANSSFESAPVSSGLNSIQIWIWICIIFVTSTVIEYSIILVLQRVVKKKELNTKLKIMESEVCMLRSRNTLLGGTETALNIVLTYADFIGLLTLSISFFVFNICYWSLIN
nr:gamma-aminobutyric acid receptor subunit rho-2-like [Lepeophtheirus salmonis]